MLNLRVAVFAFCAVLLVVRAGEAGQKVDPRQTPRREPGSVAAPPFAFDGPPPPLPPEVISRDTEGRATVRAVRIAQSLRIDGTLDERPYGDVRPMSDLIQNEPVEGAPATQRTEVWLLFDDENVYVSARCFESHPERMVANTMRHDDSSNLAQNEYVIWSFDTFYDRRNGFSFGITPIGGWQEGQYTNERQYHGDYNGIWNVAVGRFEGGWTFEAAIPFKSLRYPPGREQIWGFQVQRNNRWKNELAFLTRMPASRGQLGFMQSSLHPTVVGLEAPPSGRNLEIKPYAIANLSTDLAARPRISNDPGADIGLDVKYGVTQNLTADFTVNTDFAQVEADEQQVNLTRFSLFFPEKREFFLENQGTFNFGGGGAAVGGGAATTPNDTPLLFYSRRIGFEQGREVPIHAGGRLTGRLGRYTFGAINIQAGDEPLANTVATNYSVLRVKRDILRKSSIGAIFTGRSRSQLGAGGNEALGLDGTFAFFDNLAINTYWARTWTPGVSGDDVSYRGQLDYAGDRYGVQLEHLFIGDHFNPEVGFLRRDNMRRSYAQLRFSPRPRRIRAVRKFSWTASGAYIEDGQGRLETRNFDGEFSTQFQNSDQFLVGYSSTYEFLPLPFRLSPGVTLPVGGYDFWSARAAFNFGQHRPLHGNLSIEHGAFYSGEKTTLTISRGRVEITPRFTLEPSFSINWVDVAEGSFTTNLVGSRVTYTMTPRMFVSALLQYNSANNTVSGNVRLRWEYLPGSELFAVYNEQRDTLARTFPALANRAFIVKVNRLLRF